MYALMSSINSITALKLNDLVDFYKKKIRRKEIVYKRICQRNNEVNCEMVIN